MRNGEPLPLPPKVFDTLLVLVENSGAVLAKDELLRTIWPDSFVEESNLAQNISQLRKALGENSSEQRFIETIPKRGYRFVAPVKKVERAVPEYASVRQSGASIFEDDDELSVEEAEIEEAKPKLNPSYIPQNLAETAPLKPVGHQAGRKLNYILIAVVGFVLISFIGYGIFRLRQSSSSVSFQNMRINKLTSSGKARWPAISADGKYIAYVQNENGKRSLWVRQVAATSSVQILPPADVTYNGVTFSPDGNFVYYVVEEKGKGPGLRYSSLYRIPQLGGTPSKLIEDVDSAVTFSPDGRQIAFVRHYPTKKESVIIVANEDGTGDRTLVVRQMPKVFSPVGPSWSPDGKLIVCAVGNKGEHGSLMGVSLVRVADGTEEPLGP
ncbi:MAG TPA: LpqB family beta-propeller domain-containing protein, partial [Blastocatellia bacterium]|nr:LpqB family beta-propeller domain-containing protein [Blastocatellia bacterium]